MREKKNNSSGIKELEEIIRQVVQTVQGARDDIFQIADEARQEYSRIATEVMELKQQTLGLISKVDFCEQEERLARIRLMEVSRNFDTFSEEDLKEAYENARELQVQLGVLREQERNLIGRRNELERSLKRMEEVAHRAEDLVDRVNMVMKMLMGSAETIFDRLEDAHRNQQLGVWIIQAQEEERRKIARELHDGPAQDLANLAMRLDLVEKLWERDQAKAREEISRLKVMLRSNLDDVRRVIFDLRPMSLDDLGLIPALKRYLTEYEFKYGITSDFKFFGEERRLAPPMEVALFRLIQEALTNVRKHAGVSEVIVKMEMGKNQVTAVVKDEGRGFDPEMMEESRDSFGLVGMRERVKLFGGEINIKSKSLRGTQVIISLPLQQEGGENK